MVETDGTGGTEDMVEVIDLDKRSFQRRYYLGYLLVYLILIFTNWYFLVDTTNPLSIVLFATMAFLFIGLAYNIMDLICYYAVSEDALPCLKKLPKKTKRPRVALLYCTYNDCDPECLEMAGHQDYPMDVFVLDDSSDLLKRAVVDKIADGSDYRVVRRKSRAGFKAGALNNWLRRFGQSYDYIAILDADSKLPTDFISRSLLIAEHPANEDISIFQARVNIHNRNNMFTHLMAYSPSLWYPSFRRLANRLDWMMCWGHNNLLRTSHVMDVGGWDETHVSEDFALAMDLRKDGKSAVLTNIDTYESCPPDFRAYKSRACRWAKGTLKCFEYLNDGDIPRSTRFMLFLTGWCTLAFFGYFVALLLMVFGFRSDLGLVVNLTETVARDFGWFLDRPGAMVLVAFYFLFLIFGRVVLTTKNSMSFKTYLSHICLGLSLNMLLVLPMMYHQMTAFFKKKMSFKVTPKHSSNEDIWSFLGNNAGHMVFMTVLMAGVIFYNPIGLIYNGFWLTILVLAPFIVWYLQNSPNDTEVPPFSPAPIPCQRISKRAIPELKIAHTASRD